MIKALRRLEPVEKLIPLRWRLPLRFGLQKVTGNLEPELALLPQLCAADRMAVDVGANRGIYSIALARLASGVHCLEPLPICCDYINAAQLPGVQVHCCAVSDVMGIARFFVPTKSGTPVWTRASLEEPVAPSIEYSVPVRTLDSFGWSNVGFVKIDVEGAEAAVLRGGARLLVEQHPNLLVEIDRARHSEGSFMGLIGWLESIGYDAHGCCAGKLVASRDPGHDASSLCNFVFL